MDQDSAHMVAASKVSMLKPGEFEIWWMRIEQYIQMIDYALWEVIENVNTAQAVNTAHGVSTASTQVNAAYSTNIGNLSDTVICSFFASQPNSPLLVHEALEQIHPYDMEEMDLRRQMTMLTMRARRFMKKIRRKLTVNENETIGFDKSK
nr:hypothetical protein [Tanacetum cinerariifolium]